MKTEYKLWGTNKNKDMFHEKSRFVKYLEKFEANKGELRNSK